LFGGLKYDAFHPVLLVDVLKPVVLQELTTTPQEWQFCCWETCLLCRKALSWGYQTSCFPRDFPLSQSIDTPIFSNSGSQQQLPRYDLNKWLDSAGDLLNKNDLQQAALQWFFSS